MTAIGFGIFVERKNLNVDLIDEDPAYISGPFHENLFNGIDQIQDFNIDNFSALDGKEPENIIFIGRILDPERFFPDLSDLINFTTIADANTVMLEVCDFLDEMGIYRLTDPALCFLNFEI